MFPVFPMLPVASFNAQCRLGIGNIGNWQHFHIGNILALATFIVGLIFAPCARAENAYTNHAGNVVSGWPVRLTQKEVTLAEGVVTNDYRLATNDCRLTTNDCRLTTNDCRLTTNDYRLATTYPLSIFPESERRRIAADFLLRQGQAGGQIGLLRVPLAVKRAVSGAEKAIARSRKRAEKGLCTKEESDAFCAKTEAALKGYLDKQVKEGVITPAERKATGH